MNIRATMLYLCLLFISTGAIAQPGKPTVAQIEKKIALSRDDTNKVLLYMKLDSLEFSALNYLSLSDSPPHNGIVETMPSITQKAYSLSVKLKYAHGLVISLMEFGTYNEVLIKNYVKANSYYKEAAKIAEVQRSYRDENLAYGAILNMYYYLGDYANAMVIAQKGLALAEQRNDKTKVAHYNNQLGFIYLKQEKPIESIKYYRLYFNLAMQSGDPMRLADSYICMADVYLFEKDYQTSVIYLFKALNIYKNYKKLNYSARDRIAYTLYKISNAYKLHGQYQLSLKYAISGFDYGGGKLGPAYNQYDLASYYIY